MRCQQRAYDVLNERFPAEAGDSTIVLFAVPTGVCGLLIATEVR
jgi:hypothetical protein